MTQAEKYNLIHDLRKIETALIKDKLEHSYALTLTRKLITDQQQYKITD